MANIPLRNRQRQIVAYAVVDDEDADGMSVFNWRMAKGYAGFRTGGRANPHMIYMHKLILDTQDEVDHIDGDPLNNRRENLRVATRAQNIQNLALHRDKKTSKSRGVDLCPGGRWRARVILNYKENYLGYFDTEEEAAKAAADFRVANMPFTNEARYG